MSLSTIRVIRQGQADGPTLTIDSSYFHPILLRHFKKMHVSYTTNTEKDLFLFRTKNEKNWEEKRGINDTKCFWYNE